MKKRSRDQRRRKRVAERERRRAAFEQRFVSATAEPFAELSKVLKGIAAGDVVQGHHDCDTALVERGKVFNPGDDLKIIEGQPTQCYKNVALWYYLHAGVLNVATGYAFQNDMGRWVGHSWLVDGNTILETTHKRDYYFGIVLEGMEVFNFLLNRMLGVIEEYGMNVESDGWHVVLTPKCATR